ncbi:MAG: hypothetical protein ACRD68_11560, partial [Pyrinomonadaceae bacterium]
VVRKDWSGVVVLSLSAGAVSVNGEPVEAPRRLRNGDRLTLLPAAPPAPDAESPSLVFHEPASLLVLDSLLPQQQLPPPVTTAVTAPHGREAQPAAAPAPRPAAAVARKSPGLFDPGRRYFEYFTLPEILIMACGTLVAAVVIFFVLEWLSS